jgi:hypothetical protein
LIGFSGLRQRIKFSAESPPGFGWTSDPLIGAEPRFNPARSRISRRENCIISVMEKARSGRLMIFRFVDGLRVRLFDLLFAIGLTQRTDQFAVV